MGGKREGKEWTDEEGEVRVHDAGHADKGGTGRRGRKGRCRGSHGSPVTVRWLCQGAGKCCAGRKCRLYVAVLNQRSNESREKVYIPIGKSGNFLRRVLVLTRSGILVNPSQGIVRDCDMQARF